MINGFHKNAIFILLLAIILTAGTALAQQFDPATSWPLCGRITENPSLGWTEEQGCPVERWGNSDFTDLPFSSTFGPRLNASDNFKYDFHRGIDIIM